MRVERSERCSRTVAASDFTAHSQSTNSTTSTVKRFLAQPRSSRGGSDALSEDYEIKGVPVLKRLIIGLAVLLSLPFVAVAVAIGYLLFAEWRERLRNPPATA